MHLIVMNWYKPFFSSKTKNGGKKAKKEKQGCAKSWERMKSTAFSPSIENRNK